MAEIVRCLRARGRLWQLPLWGLFWLLGQAQKAPPARR